MKNKITRILGVVLTITLLSSLAMVTVPVSAAGSSAVINTWETLAPLNTSVDTDIDIIVQAEDGTFFISVWDGGTSTYSMYKSADGYAWAPTCLMGLTNRITAIEPADNYSVNGTVYVAVDTSAFTTIYRCRGTAATSEIPIELGQISAGASGTREATIVRSIDSYYSNADGYVWLLVATDIDVFAMRDDNGLTTVWTDMELSQTLGGSFTDAAALGGVPVYKAMFAPDYDQTGVIWALYHDNDDDTGTPTGSDTLGYGLIARSSGSTLWGTTITPEIISSSSGSAKSQCDIEFADGYSSNPTDASANLYAALSFWGPTSDDDLYSIQCDFYGAPASITPFLVDGGGKDFCSLEVSGNLLMAGTFDMSAPNAEVWVSQNNGVTWNEASKNPTGSFNYPCNVLISTAGSTTGLAFAATGGSQSAISVSEDNGDTWNQIAFIDTTISSIDDLAFDPTGTSAAMITYDSTDSTFSLWKTADVNVAAPQWQRTLCTAYSTTINEFTMVEYSMDGAVAMLYDESNDQVYRSSNNLQTFAPWKSTTLWGTINDWVVYDSASVYAACDNGFWSTAVVGSDLVGVDLESIAIQTGFDPGDSAADVLVVGDVNGNAYISYDAGDNLEVAVSIAGSGNVYVAFDASNTIYFANGTVVYTAAIGATNIGTRTTMPSTGVGTLVDIAVSPDDTLYVLDSGGDLSRYLINDTRVDGTQSGWDRADNSTGTTWELWITSGSNVAWTTDGSDVFLLDDTLTGMVSVTVTNVSAFGCTVSWTAMTGATHYQVKFYEYNAVTDSWSTYYSSIYIAAPLTSMNTADYFTMFFDDATDYRVDVRVNNNGSSSISDEVEYSRYSVHQAFTTKYFMDMPFPVNPSQGNEEVSLYPAFGWSAVPNAASYTVHVSDQANFSNLLADVSVTTTAYTYDGAALAYDTPYYWRVRAVAPDNSVGIWSTYTETYDIYVSWWGSYLQFWVSGAISSFHTEEEELPQVTIPPQITPIVTVNMPQATLTVVPPAVNVTVVPPEINVDIPEMVTITQTQAAAITLIAPEPVDEGTPVYIWVIVGIGAVLTISVIVLIIRTRRVV